MDKSIWRGMLPPWLLAWLVLLCGLATLVVVIWCCPCKGTQGGPGSGPDQTQPVVPLQKMRLSEPNDAGDIPDPRPIPTVEYKRASGPGGQTPQGMPPVRTSTLATLPIQPTPGQFAEHAPAGGDGPTRSLMLRMKVGDDGWHESSWITAYVATQPRMIKFAMATFTRKDAANYYVRLDLTVYNSSGTDEDPTPLVLLDVPLTPVP
jgi:hypothetical protein